MCTLLSSRFIRRRRKTEKATVPRCQPAAQNVRFIWRRRNEQEQMMTFFSPLRRFILQPWQSILLLYSKDIWLFVGLYRELWKRCWQPLRRKGQSQLRSGLSESDHFQIGLPSKGQAMMRSAINIQHEIIRFWWKVAVISVWSFFFVCLVKLIPVITAEDCKVYLWMNGYMAN